MANRAVVRKGVERLRQGGFADHELEICELTTSTVLGEGDLVYLTGTTSTDARFPVVARAANSTAFYGIFVGKKDVTHEDIPGYYSGSGAAYGYIYPLKLNEIYTMQEDGDGGFLAASSVNLVCDIATVTDASSVTGRSNMVLDSSTAVNNAARNVLLCGIAEEVDNVTGDVYTRWKVKFIELQITPSFDGE